MSNAICIIVTFLQTWLTFVHEGVIVSPIDVSRDKLLDGPLCVFLYFRAGRLASYKTQLFNV